MPWQDDKEQWYCHRISVIHVGSTVVTQCEDSGLWTHGTIISHSNHNQNRSQKVKFTKLVISWSDMQNKWSQSCNSHLYLKEQEQRKYWHNKTTDDVFICYRISEQLCILIPIQCAKHTHPVTKIPVEKTSVKQVEHNTVHTETDVREDDTHHTAHF